MVNVTYHIRKGYDGTIIDSLVFGMSNPIMSMRDSIKVLNIYTFPNVMKIFINSGSGQAAVTMPILIPSRNLIRI
ncbi:hypothetical protein [Sporosarcina ureae]|uniref:hypothetical protein n=1 Tax=Sporosarcina ureae TaxID=1571 RepID=UPI0023EA56D3|nr:hypothetical protein [Sporosarcina ureae]